MLRLGFATFCLATGLCWSGCAVAAQTPAAPGSKAVIDFEITIEGKHSSQGKDGESSEWRVLRHLALSYEMTAGALSPASLYDSQLQAQQVEQATAMGEQGNQAVTNNANLMAQMQAAVEACGEDEACVEAYVMKLAQDPQLQQMSKDSAQVGQTMQAYNQANAPRFQQWSVVSAKPLAGAYEIEEWRKDVIYDPICYQTNNLCTSTRERKVEAKIDPGDQTAGAAPSVEVDTLKDTITVVLTHPMFTPTIQQVTQDGPGEAQVRFLPYDQSDYEPVLKYLAISLKGSYANQKGEGSVTFNELEDYRGPLKMAVRWHFRVE